jgi:hypothetical protein
MSYSFATFCDLLCEETTNEILVQIVLRCLPHVVQSTLADILAGMEQPTKDLEMQLLTVFVVSKLFDTVAAFPLLESAKYAKEIVRNSALLWTSNQQTRFGTVPLTDLFFRGIISNADVQVFLEHVPKVAVIVKQQFPFYVCEKAQQLNAYLSTQSDTIDEDTFFPFVCSAVEHFKRLHQESFFKDDVEARVFFFDTVPLLQTLGTADKQKIVDVFT